MKGKRLHAEQTRQNLLEAFWRLYRDKDLHQISVREVTELAGYHRGTFYHHFRDIPHLLEVIEEEQITDTKFEQVLPGLPESYQALREIASGFFRTHAKNERFQTLIGPGGDPGFARRFHLANLPAFKERFAPIIKTDPKSTDVILLFLHAGSTAVLNQWTLDDDPMPEEDFEQLLQVLYQAIFNVLAVESDPDMDI